jgi:ketosteroid isomerase-like protein
MHSNGSLITTFYEAFDRCDGDAMAACYHDEATFTDPVFAGLDGQQAGDMWRMLTSQASDLRVKFGEVQADDDTGSAHWEAWYTFSATGRKVHNIIEARFQFRDGEIIEHVDDFDFWRWSRMALGLPGIFLGWTPLLQNKVRAQAQKGLARFRQQ